MKIALYHGYELTGSGSNEYTRYLAVALNGLGHEVVILCSEPVPEEHAFVDRCYSFETPQRAVLRFDRSTDKPGSVTLYQLPQASTLPVYITDKQRAGVVKQFIDLTDQELAHYHRTTAEGVRTALKAERPDVVHANHLVWQPVVAAEVCGSLEIPFYIVAHGSSLEYAVRRDARYRRAAEEALLRSDGLVWIAPNVQQRVVELYDQHREVIRQRSFFAGTGVDTSLFRLAERSERPRSLGRLIAAGPFRGKSRKQKTALTDRLDGGDLESIRDYWSAYDHRVPDEDLAAQLNSIAPDDDLLLYVGALTWGKGVQALLAAMPEILSNRPTARLLIVGSGTFREALEALAHSIETANESLFDEVLARGRALDRDATPEPLIDVRDYSTVARRRQILFEHGPRLAGRVHFLGRLDHSQLRWVFPCCQLAVFPSIVHEASPLVLAESMANGVLPAAAYHSGLRDGLDALADDLPLDVFNRLRIDDDLSTRVASLADNVSWLLAKGVSNALSRDLRRIAEERHDWQSTATAIASAAQAIVDSHGSPGSHGPASSPDAVVHGRRRLHQYAPPL